VLLKPNIASCDRSGSGKVTDARVTEAIAKIVLKRRPRSLIIGEGSGVGYDFPDLQDTQTALRESGTKAVAEKLGLPVVDLNVDRHREVEVPNPLVMKSVKIAQTVLESQVIISIPVMKTHIRSAVTLSLKNMKGVLPGEEKKKTHRLGLELAIADLNSIVKPAFVVVDGLVGMEGIWEYPNDCVPMGLVGAGRDQVAVDSVFAQIMGASPQAIMHLVYCQSKGLGACDPGAIEVVGAPISEVRRPFHPAFEVLRKRYPGLTIEDSLQQAAGIFKCKVYFTIFSSLANPAASCGECARYAFSSGKSLHRMHRGVPQHPHLHPGGPAGKLLAGPDRHHG